MDECLVIMEGRLTADAVFTPGKEATQNRANFSLAVTDRRNYNKTHFFNVVAWGNRADYIKKGQESGRYLKG